MIRRLPSQQLFPITLLGLLAALSFWLSQTAELPEGRHDGKARHDPDAVVENFEVRRMDETGNLQYRLTAPRMEHYPDDDSSLLTRPRLEHFSRKVPNMTLTGKNGYVSNKGETVYFWDDVVATRAATAGRAEMVARMPDLTVRPDEGTAFTDSPVEIVQDRSRIRGVGMFLNNNTSVITLKSQVTGTYYRPKAPQ